MRPLFSRSLIAWIVALCFGITTASAAPPLTPIQQMYVLKEMKPDMERVGVIWRKDAPNHDKLMPQIQRAAAASGVKIFMAYANSIQDVAPSYRALKQKHNIDVLWIIEDETPMNSSVARNFLIKTATENGVPILAPSKAWVDAGAPVSLQKAGDDIQIIVNKAAAAATALTVPEDYNTQYLTSR